MRTIKLLILTLILSLLAGAPAVASGEFPGRGLFPTVEFIEREDLRARYDDVTIVDVRSDYEYQTLHIAGAHSIPMSKDTFVADVKALQATTGKPVVFYCNGRTCRVSYQAAERATRGGIPGTKAYDAGIFEWAEAYPDKAVLLGQSPIKVTDLISSARFKQHQLEAEVFADRVGPNTLVLDVRDDFQRDGIALFPFRERRIALNDKDALRDAVRQARAENKTLLIYDSVGRQVQWLQYSLEALGARDYYFMAGGEQAYFNMLSKANATR